jgi:hypothetical protein
MNKLILFCLLSLMILYAQCEGEDPCTSHSKTEQSLCSSVKLNGNQICDDDPDDTTNTKCKPRATTDNDCTSHTKTAQSPCSSINLGNTKDCIDDTANAGKCKPAEIKTDNDCTGHTKTDQSPCSSIYLGNTKDCIDDKANAGKCTPVTKPSKTENKETKSSNSSDILNIFKISFALLIIFTIL